MASTWIEKSVATPKWHNFSSPNIKMIMISSFIERIIHQKYRKLHFEILNDKFQQ